MRGRLALAQFVVLARESEERLRALADELETKVSVRTQELKQRNIEVLEQSELLRELSTRLLQIQDSERRHIARELHDSAGQIVAALGMKLASVARHARQNPLLANALEEGQQLVQELSKEIRTTSYLQDDGKGIPAQKLAEI
jgi:signal transduction histidine kinase